MKAPPDLKRKFRQLWPHLNERAKRLVAAEEACDSDSEAFRWSVAPAGCRGLRSLRPLGSWMPAIGRGRIRREGAGRPSWFAGPEPAGSPGGVGGALDAGGSPVALALDVQEHAGVGKATGSSAAFGQPRETGSTAAGYELQPSGQPQTLEGKKPSRPRRAVPVHQRAGAKALAAGQPVISVDTKKKELIGDFENQGRQWRKTKSPTDVNGHDFADPSIPRAYPYGIYDWRRIKDSST